MTAAATPKVARIVDGVRDQVELSRRVVARMLGRAESTLRSWCGKAVEVAAGVVHRVCGRPGRLADSLQRRDIVQVIHESGGKVSTRKLKRAYPDVGRAQLRSLLRRYRFARRKRVRRALAVLRWQRPGGVWAMDFTEVAGGVEDFGRHVLVVRDLASGVCLAAVPGHAQDAASAVSVLRRLFAEHGAPLVLKSDNGSAFIAHGTRAALAEHGVLPLFSPPGTPSYNGACEAGVGSVKHRADALAAARGRPCGLSLDDLEGGRLQANEQPAEPRAGAPTRAHCWQERAPLTAASRAELQQRVAHWRRRARDERGIARDGVLAHALSASIDRFAIGKALHELRFLVTWRR